MIYLDSSALLKLIRMENETAALRDWLGQRPEQPVVSSELGRVEVLRAARRVGGRALTEARAVQRRADGLHCLRPTAYQRGPGRRLGRCHARRSPDAVRPDPRLATKTGNQRT